QAESTFAVDFFSGSIDEVSFCARVLSEADIRSTFQAGSAGKCVGAPPSIIGQPQSQSVFAGDDVTLQVSAAGAFSYQWRFNGSNIPGATNLSLQLSNVQPGNSGTYNVVVANSSGSLPSSDAVLTVEVGPECTPAPSGAISWWTGDDTVADLVGGNNGS